jgi:FkbM family methyltransferase
MNAAFDVVARILAAPLNAGVFVGPYRRSFFKGKLAIAQHVRRFPPNGVYECDGLLYELDFADNIQQTIWLNIYEWRDWLAIRNLIRPGHVAFDIGANIGFYTMQFARLVGPTGRVHAFEPLLENRVRLQLNIELNGLGDRIVVNREAVSATTGSANLSSTPDRNSGFAKIVPDGEPVPTISVVDYLAKNGIDLVHFLKCDIEGHEPEMLKGAARSLGAGRIEWVMIEHNGRNLGPAGHTLRSVIETFAGYGYAPVVLSMDRVSAAASLGADPDTYNLLFHRPHHPQMAKAPRPSGASTASVRGNLRRGGPANADRTPV